MRYAVRHPVRSTAIAVLLLGTGACADFLSSNGNAAINSQALTAAFSTVPVGFSSNSSSYSGDSDGVPSLWLPGEHARGFGREGLMGGGLDDNFAGAMPPGTASVTTDRSVGASAVGAPARARLMPAPDGLSVPR